ncbi:MAG: hypothetical protein JWQ98_1970 [Chlorobi bacterium]|nr:hypothetical protein [Chlorobiota bacterium]
MCDFNLNDERVARGEKPSIPDSAKQAEIPM